MPDEGKVTLEDLYAAADRVERDAVVDVQEEPKAEPPEPAVIDDAVEPETPPEAPETAPEPEVVEGDEPDAEPEEPTEQAARSKLGRRVAELQRQLEATNNQRAAEQKEMRDLLNQLLGQQKALAPTEPAKVVEEERPDPYEDPEGFYRYMRKRELISESAAATKYENDYQKAFIEMGADDDPELFKSVFNEMYTNFNHRLTGDAEKDARTNYAKAFKSVVKRSGGIAPPQKPMPLKGAPPVAPLGSGTTPRATPKPAGAPVNPELVRIAKMLGVKMTDEEMNEMASKPKGQGEQTRFTIG